MKLTPHWGYGKGKTQANQLSYHPGPDPGPWVDPPQHLPYWWAARAQEWIAPADPQPQELHDWEQQQKIWEQSWWGSSADGVAEARSLEVDSLQWTFTGKAVWMKHRTVCHTAASSAIRKDACVTEDGEDREEG